MTPTKDTPIEARLIRQCVLQMEDGTRLRFGETVELPAERVRTDDKFCAHTDRGRVIVALIGSYNHRRMIVKGLGLETNDETDESYVAALEAYLEDDVST